MAYKRRKRVFKGKKRVFRRKKRFVRRSKGRRIRKQQMVYAKFSSHDLLSAPGGANTARALSFSLDNFAGIDPYKTLFEQFRVVKIKYEQKSRSTVIPLVGSATTNTTGGYIIHALDFDDNVAWSSVAEGRNSWSARTTNFLGGFRRYWTPRCLNAVKLATGTNTFVDNPIPSPWLPISGSGTAHYGLKWIWAMGGATTNNYAIDQFITFYCQFRHRTGK